MSSPFTSHLSPFTVHPHRSPLTSHLSLPPAPQPPREPEAKAGAFAYIRRSASHLSPLTSHLLRPPASPRTGGKGWSLRLQSPFRLSPLTSPFSPPPAPRLPANRRQRLEPSLTFASHLSPLTSHLLRPLNLPANRRQRLEPSLTFAVPPLTSHFSPPPASHLSPPDAFSLLRFSNQCTTGNNR